MDGQGLWMFQCALVPIAWTVLVRKEESDSAVPRLHETMDAVVLVRRPQAGSDRVAAAG